MEQLISWHHLQGWREWGRSFNKILRSNFLVAKLKAERLKDVELNFHLNAMQKLANNFPRNQRLSTQLDSQSQLFWKKESAQADKDFHTDWKSYQESWSKLKDLLLKEGHYQMPSEKAENSNLSKE